MIKYETIAKENFIPSKRTKHKVQDFLKEFEESEDSVRKLDWWSSGYSSANTMAESIKHGIRILGYGMHCFIRDRQVWIYKTLDF